MEADQHDQHPGERDRKRKKPKAHNESHDRTCERTNSHFGESPRDHLGFSPSIRLSRDASSSNFRHDVGEIVAYAEIT